MSSQLRMFDLSPIRPTRKSGRCLAFGRVRAKPHTLKPSEVKPLVRHRDGYRCRECGMTARQHVRTFGKTLDVHRLVPGSRYTVKGCVTLCKYCHANKPVSPRSPNRLGPRSIRVGMELFERLDILCDLQASTPAAEITAAIREHLEKHGLWPPPSRRNTSD